MKPCPTCLKKIPKDQLFCWKCHEKFLKYIKGNKNIFERLNDFIRKCKIEKLLK